MQQWRDRAAERWERKRERWERHARRWGGPNRGGLRQTGNRAFDEYRDDALRKLEEEAGEFRSFLERLRSARDRAEFDEFMNERRNRPAGEPGGPSEAPQGPAPQPQS
jgi:hypothetical protein